MPLELRLGSKGGRDARNRCLAPGEGWEREAGSMTGDAVTRVLAALNAKRIDDFVACYAQDATIEDGLRRRARAGA